MSLFLEKSEFKGLLPELVVYLLTDTFLSKVFDRFSDGQAPVTDNFAVRRNNRDIETLTAKGQVAKHLAMEITLVGHNMGNLLEIQLIPTGGCLEPAGRDGHIVGYFKTGLEIWCDRADKAGLQQIKAYVGAYDKTHIDYAEIDKQKQAKAILELIKPYL